jgi:GntR family transcriptional repressor for pyruvate dehydrogenase complex
MLSIESRQTFDNVFRVRLTIEADTAYLAARHRSEADLARMEAIVEDMDRRIGEASQAWAEADLALHREIAVATGNDLYPMLIEALSGFIEHVQATVDEAVRPQREMTQYFHRSIVECIRNKDAEFARVQMQAHLRNSAGHIVRSGILEPDALITNQGFNWSI